MKNTLGCAHELSIFLGVEFDSTPADPEPKTLEEAIRALFQRHRGTWDSLARTGWGLSKRQSQLLTVGAVLQTIRETDFSESYPEMTQHFIDPEGKYRVTVYH